jgi:mannose/fructose/N-acetylgalactosamine-specific phosphotransferase system component IIC
MQTYSLLLGYIPAVMFLAMIGFAAVGVAMALLIDSQKRDQNSKNTPVKFSFRFLLKDNWKTIVLTFLAILVTLRFVAWLFPGQFTVESLDTPAVKEKWLFGSFLIGIGYNTLLQYLKDKADLLKVKRDVPADVTSTP